MEDNTKGFQNTALGSDALSSNQKGINNSAFGYNALLNNTEGNRNTCIGSLALKNNKKGNNNVAVGFKAGLTLINGSSNIVIGNDAQLSSSSTAMKKKKCVYFLGQFGNDAPTSKILQEALLTNNVDISQCGYSKLYPTGRGYVMIIPRTGEVCAVVSGGSNLYGWKDWGPMTNGDYDDVKNENNNNKDDSSSSGTSITSSILQQEE